MRSLQDGFSLDVAFAGYEQEDICSTGLNVMVQKATQ
jgi:hypothetical protein